ncbi:hypothetical protein ACPOL_6109 [Acidisarcina polymorpha]|uniref:Zinc-finger domain-containing protein n=1 Tax=Acidisarcina polymorpha TaxID=2211140 RepID=A0A2Z5G7V5_9BACT|nr:hypothetical protein [Acidisarcina polymorpha]AXC15353.1 hypothetical protein ACPOL_6109 [Acidisarcina polymorpha]
MTLDMSRMEKHLTSNEISRLLVEGSWLEAEEHLRQCRNCQAQLAGIKEPLVAFRTAVMDWSEAQESKPIRETETSLTVRERLSFMNWAPALSLAFALAVLAALLVSPAAFHPASAPLQAGLAAPSDTVLMEQVDQEVSEAVPDALAPLTDLVSWESSAGSSSLGKSSAGVVDSSAGTMPRRSPGKSTPRAHAGQAKESIPD